MILPPIKAMRPDTIREQAKEKRIVRRYEYDRILEAESESEREIYGENVWNMKDTTVLVAVRLK